MSPTAGNGSSKPQTLTGRIMAAFTGPGRPPGAQTENPRSPEILPPEERKG